MGDRGNIRVYQNKEGSESVYLYGHWSGHDMFSVLQTSLNRRQRWSDGSYLTRIIFSELIKDDILGENSYGISTSLCGNEYPIFGVRPETKTVTIETESGTIERMFSFEDFCKLEW